MCLGLNPEQRKCLTDREHTLLVGLSEDEGMEVEEEDAGLERERYLGND